MEGKNTLSVFEKILAGLGILVAVWIVVFLIGRYGWKLAGFSACEGAGIERVEVTEGMVRITGFDPAVFPEGFLGYHAKEKNGALYVGFKFSGVFGFFKSGDFEISIPTRSEIKKVYMKTADHEYLIWPEEG